tara:strand:- start:9444 stop:9656 length:213 start_codon:yes stop_codon:yes gene_type:complete
MSNKYDGLIVTFKTEVSEEYADKIKAAICMFHHVVSVDYIEENIMEKMTHKMQMNKEVRDTLIEFIREKL